MLWSALKAWPEDLPLPAEVRRHMRIEGYLQAKEGDLEGWRFPKVRDLAAFDARIGPPTPKDLERRREMAEGIAEIDRVLRWMRNTDWPFR